MSDDDQTDQLRHIRVPDSAKRLSYTPVTGRGNSSELPERNRESHANNLLAQIDGALAKGRQVQEVRDKYDVPGCDGDVVSVEVKDASVATSLEDRRYRRRLLTFKPHDGDSNAGIATVYVPFSEFQTFQKKIERYRDEERSDSGKPKNQKLVQNIEEVRRAALHERWTDPVEEEPPDGDSEDWWEVWVRDAVEDELFRKQVDRVGLEIRPRYLKFPGRRVYIVHGTQSELASSLDLLDSVAELRRARPVTQDFLEFSPSLQSEWIDDLAERLEKPDDSSPAVCLLDTGLFASHDLLEPAVDPRGVDTVRPNWDPDDSYPNGHGTPMAGMALYGQHLDYWLEQSEKLKLRHWLESVKILPRPGANDPDVYGDITKQAVVTAELNVPERDRVFSMAVTEDPSPKGEPTSWSAAVDQLTSGAEEEGRPRRLICISSGNVPTDETYSYPDTNLVSPIQDPAQAWNALTIGAATERTQIEPSEDYPDWEPVAPAGEMSPSNSTSFSLVRDWPSKPDLVMEGGNKAISPSFDKPDHLDSLALLTTKGPTATNPNTRLTATAGTSPASAQVARMAAHLQAEYPDYWPETIRALLIHSARWTAPMEQRFSDKPDSEEARCRLRCYGYGVPSLRRALHSTRSSTVLVIQDELQPFVVPEDSYDARSNKMNLHELPWPSKVLGALGGLEVRMRVTLSYFVEPNPAKRGPSNRYEYASHLLGFKVQTPLESDEEFRKRINKDERDQGEGSTSSSDSGDWKIGPEARSGGSIHSDVWEGTAVQLANRQHIGVVPKTGWWKEYKSQERVEAETRYALIVSIETDQTEVEIEGEIQAVDFYEAIEEEVGVQPTVET